MKTILIVICAVLTGVLHAVELNPFKEPISRARWLWYQAPSVAGHGIARYRCTIDLDEPVDSCWILTALDDKGAVWLNGTPLKECTFRQPDMQVRFHRFEPEGWLPGRNVIAVEVRNTGALGGMILRGEIRLRSGKVIPLVSSRELWRASGENADGWTRVGFDDSGWQPAMILGDVLMEPWKSVSNVVAYMLDDGERAAYERVLSGLADIGFLKDEPEWKARIVSREGMAGIELNGQPEAPMTFVLGFNPWIPNTAEDILEAGRHGIRFTEYITSSNRCFVAPGEYDFTPLGMDIRRILSLNPNTAIIVAFRLDLQGRWLDENPDELIGYATGPADGKGGQLGRFRGASMASGAFRAEIRNFISSAVRYMRKQLWYKRVVGIRVGYGIYGEWHYYGMKTDMPDTGKAMTAAFREFLRKRYGSDAALRSAWKDPDVTLANAAVPGSEERIGDGSFFRNPANGRDRKVLDYYECHGNVIADTLLDFAGAAKSVDPRLLVGAYHGYLFCMGYPAEAQTLLLDKVLGSPNIDFLSSPNSYDTASRVAGGDGLPRMIPSVFRRHGKLAIIESDVHTHRTAKRDVYRVGDTPEHSQAVFRRDIALAWLVGGGIQFLEFDARRGKTSWFSDPLIYRSWQEGRAMWRRLYETQRLTPCDAAVVVSPIEMYRHGYPNGFEQRPIVETLLDKTMHALYKSGGVFDVLSLDDFLASEHTYRLVIFLNLFSPSDAERAGIGKKIRRPGVTAVWSFAPGYVTEHGFSEDAMSALTGIKLGALPEKKPLAVTFLDYTRMASVNGKKGIVAEKPRVFARDAAAELWARYSDGGREPAIVWKTLPDGSHSLFCGVPLMDPHVWAAVFDRSGVHRFAPPGTMIAGNAEHLLVHTGDRGALELTLPRKARNVRELFTGNLIGKEQRTLLLRSSTPATWFLEITY